MKKTFFTATLAVFCTSNVQANSVGLYLGGQIWQREASGFFGEKQNPINSDLNKAQQNNYFVAAEHPFPFLPNVRISNTKFDTTAKTNVVQESKFDNETSHVNLHVNSDLNASFNISYIDYTLYYQVIDNSLFSFDLGIVGRDFDVTATVTETTNTVTTTSDFIWDVEEHEGHDHSVTEITDTITTDNKKKSKVVPMLYVATNASLPLANLSVFAQGNVSLKDDYSLYNYQVGLSYRLLDQAEMDFNLTVGYQAEKIEFENVNNLYADVELKGAFVGVIAHF